MPLLADEDRLHRGLHVVVDAAGAGALEKAEGAVVRVEHHLLRLTRIGADKRHAAVTKPHVGCLHGHRRAVQNDDFMAPIELVGVTRGKTQRHIGLGQRGSAFLAPAPGVTADGVITAFIAKFSQLFIKADKRQPLAGRLPIIPQKQGVELLPPGAYFGERLPFPLVMELRRIRPDDLPHHLP